MLAAAAVVVRVTVLVPSVCVTVQMFVLMSMIVIMRMFMSMVVFFFVRVHVSPIVPLVTFMNMTVCYSVLYFRMQRVLMR